MRKFSKLPETKYCISEVERDEKNGGGSDVIGADVDVI